MPSKKQVAVVPSEAEVCRAEIERIDDLRQKGVSNKNIVVNAAFTFRQRRLDAVINAELLGTVRQLLRFLSRLEAVDDHWIDSLRNHLKRAGGDR